MNNNLETKKICVFCGSTPGNDLCFLDAATALGKELANRQFELIYGGGHLGLMGAVADAVLAQGGKVTGVIPEFLMQRELLHSGLTSTHVTPTMHERKQKMFSLSDGFIALPGGIGTLEEIAEIYAWSKLDMHVKPFALLNIAGFYDSLIDFLDQVTEHGFLSKKRRGLLSVATDPATIFDEFFAS